ncbi:syntaxin binding protein 1 [Coemansia sp. RSA 552]|nr:syntaxin binding protein 1 [Coemansia sp. RSA 552]
MEAPVHTTPRSLIELIRKNVIGAIGAAAAPARWRVVVADRPSLKIISSVLKMPAVLEQHVVAIQLLTRVRQPYPDMDAVYIVVPCADTISRIIDDFKLGPRGQYACAHIFFTGMLSESLFAHLRSSPAAPYIKTAVELFIEFNPIESQVFLTTPSDQPFYTLYSPHALGTIAQDLDAAADRLLSVIVSLKARPYIRYYRPRKQAPYETLESAFVMGSTPANTCPRIAEAMASRIQLKINKYNEHRQQVEVQRGMRQADLVPSVVIILDRSIDLYAPLLHDFTYQAIVHDLVDLADGNRYTYEAEASGGQTHTIEAVLTEAKDAAWEKLRHQHIGDVSQTLADKFEKLLTENMAGKAASRTGKKLTLHEMKAALSDMPELKRLQESYSLHIDLARRCLKTANRNSLVAIADFEQELATGKTTDDQDVDPLSLGMRLIQLLDDPSLDATDRIRLLFLYLEDAVVQKPKDTGRYHWNDTEPPSGHRARACLEPAVKCIVKEQVAGTLNANLFPWAEEKPPESTPKRFVNENATSLRRREKKPQKADGERRGIVIVYIAGGVTLSEMRSVYELSETLNCDVYIGSTHVITPRGFLEDMKRLHMKAPQ